MKIVITGALGHIGSLLIRKFPFSFKGSEIWMIDNLSTERYCSLFNLPAEGRYKFIEADIMQADLAAIFESADVVIHLAAITDAASSVDNPQQVESVNFIGTQKVAQACTKTGCPLIFISTTSVYGTQDEIVDENCPLADLKPQSPYADSKLKSEQYLQSLGGVSGLRFVIYRFGTIFGTSIGMRFHTAINKFCWQAAMGKPITVWRTAMLQKRPYLDLNDAIETIFFSIRRDLFNGQVFNIVTLNTSVQRIVDTISKYVPISSIQYVDSPIMNQLSYEISNDLFKKQGFTFKGDLEKGIENTINLFKSINISEHEIYKCY